MKEIRSLALDIEPVAPKKAAAPAAAPSSAPSDDVTSLDDLADDVLAAAPVTADDALAAFDATVDDLASVDTDKE